MRLCSGCGETKPVDAFGARRRGGWQSRCRSCMAERSREWRLANLDRERQRKAAHAAVNRERVRQRSAARRAARRDHVNASVSAYRAGRPHLIWRASYLRRARKYGHPVVVEPFTRADVVERYGDACHWCGVGLFERLDHVTAVRDGGGHTLENVRPACRPCNRRRDTEARRAR